MIEINSVNTTTTELEAKCDLCDVRTELGDVVYLCSLNGDDGTIFSGVCCTTCMENSADEFSDEPYEMSDMEADADTLASCGWGTDEDYGCFGGEDY